MPDSILNQTPEDLYQELFYEIHEANLFDDGKLFADAEAKMHPAVILKSYQAESNQPSFDLKEFVHKYFTIPRIEHTNISSSNKPIDEHIQSLWSELLRAPDKVKKNRSSKIALPYSYIVPGGCFNEIYYWDSYFTMLGLREHGKIEIIQSMINNFRHLIEEYGFIPNGNRTYFLSRSQPPFYSLMVKLLIELKGKEIIPDYLPSLVREYNFWMKGISELSNPWIPINRVLKTDNDQFLNRYYDAKNTPRVEMFGDDWELCHFDPILENNLFRELRAACESGWDFSSRWLSDPKDLTTAMTTSLLPVDLNCLLWHQEKLISECYKIMNNQEYSLNYSIIAHKRKEAIQQQFWNKEHNFFCDFNWPKQKTNGQLTLAGLYPLYFKLASEEQSRLCAKVIEDHFLKDGGLVTTTIESGQQWDAPNGWAPLQWIAVKGLLQYGHKELAQKIAHRWTYLNQSVYKRTGKMLEKYNVCDITLEGGGGEYPVQDGFGWTNGVYIALNKL